MKKYLFLFLFVLGVQYSYAQPSNERIEALKIAFITQRLQITSQEAEKFWPVYREYENELKIVSADQKGKDALETEEKILDIRKKYKPDFEKILGTERMNKLFNTERDFRRILIKRLKKMKNR